MSNWLGESLRQTRQRTALAAATYAVLKARKGLKSHRLITYRCPERCLLLDVLNLPQGALFHQPPYSLAPAVNEATSNASGRRKNTRDGANRWQAQTHFADDCVNVLANCHHIHQVVLDKTDIQADLDAGHTEMILDATGQRRPQV